MLTPQESKRRSPNRGALRLLDQSWKICAGERKHQLLFTTLSPYGVGVGVGVSVGVDVGVGGG